MSDAQSRRGWRGFLHRILGARYSALVKIYWWLLSRWEDSGFWWRRRIVPLFVDRILSADVGEPGEDDLVVVCLVRDGEPWLDEFVRHYRELGARHLAFLDNGSKDRTVELLRARGSGITILSSRLPFSMFRRAMKEYMVDRFAGRGWVLVADIDEFLDVPLRGRGGLSKVLGYLNRRGFSAVVTQMLDLFSPASPFDVSTPDFRRESVWYDVSAIRRVPIDEALPGDVRGTLRVSNDSIRAHFGGIRETVFGPNPLLTKTVLFRPASGVRFRHEHWVTDAVLADFSAVLLHYKFAGDFVRRTREAVRRSNHWRRSQHEKKILQGMERDPSVRLLRDTARRLNRVDDLVESGFLIVSDEYEEAMSNEQ